VRARAEQFPFKDQSFDCAVSTLVLCTVDEPGAALHEIHRLLKPGGKLLFIEHVRADSARLARWQDRLHGLNVRIGHGCHCNRPTLESIQGANFSVGELERSRLRKMRPIVLRVEYVGKGSGVALAPLVAWVTRIRNGRYTRTQGSRISIARPRRCRCAGTSPERDPSLRRLAPARSCYRFAWRKRACGAPRSAQSSIVQTGSLSALRRGARFRTRSTVWQAPAVAPEAPAERCRSAARRLRLPCTRGYGTCS
jgi:SAM-dependent methyltransferase